MDRVPLDNFLDLEIKPRPVKPATEPVIVVPLPEPATPPVRLPEPRPTSIKGTVEHDGPTRDEILLTALTIVARREPQTEVTRGAMRNLIAKFSFECGLGF